MSNQLSKVEELIALSTRLAALVEDDVQTLKGKRPSMLLKNEADRATATLLYAKAAAEFRAPSSIASLPPSAKARLKAATSRLHVATREQTRDRKSVV